MHTWPSTATNFASASTGRPPTSTRPSRWSTSTAFDANAAALADRAAGKPIRVASKSVRCRELLSRVLARPGWHGVMAFTLPEAIWLVRAGVSDDVLVGVPDRGPGRRSPSWPPTRRSPPRSP